MKCINLSKLVTALVVTTTFGVFGVNKLSATPNVKTKFLSVDKFRPSASNGAAGQNTPQFLPASADW
jgi:hypothetical protein